MEALSAWWLAAGPLLTRHWNIRPVLASRMRSR
jgi:hypothetical protein